MKEYYYNIKRTENPYVLHYIKSEIETLSDNFKIVNENISDSPNFIGYFGDDWNGRGNREPPRFIIIDEDFLKITLQRYKEQLIENKHKVIIDVNLIENIRDDNRLVSKIREIAKAFGLSIGNTGNVSIKKLYKPKIKPKVSHPNNAIKYIIQEYISTHFGFTISISVNNKTLYNILTTFKKLCNNVSYTDLAKDSNWEHNQACEELWNNPELAKIEPKKASKRKRND